MLIYAFAAPVFKILYNPKLRQCLLRLPQLLSRREKGNKRLYNIKIIRQA